VVSTIIRSHYDSYGMRGTRSTTTYRNSNPSIHKLQRLNASMRDSDLENAVRAKLENDSQLKSADLSVNADAVRNEVTLSGTVRTHAARKKAIELAKSTKPRVAVNDKIDVKPAA
jgi:osmotically-inducible protein OsmY